MEVSPPAGSTENTAAPGATMTYTMSQRKLEQTAQITGGYITCSLPEQVTFVTGSQNPAADFTYVAAARMAQWGPFTYALNTTFDWRTYSFQVTVNTVAAGSIINTNGEFNATGQPELLSNIVRTTVPGPTIAVTKAGRATAPVGGVITYTIAYSNPSGLPVTGLSVTDTIPAGTAYVAGSLKLNGAALTDANDADAGRYTGTGIVVNPTGTLAAGTSGTVEFRVTVIGMPWSGYVSNFATFDSAETNPLNSAAVTTYITNLPADLAADKTYAVPAGEIVYTATATNASTTIPQTNVVLRCAVPANTAYKAASATNGAAEAGGIVSLNVGTLAASASASFQFTATVNNPLAGGVNIVTHSEAVSAEAGTVIGTTVTLPTVNLQLTKVADRSAVPVGGTIQYTITYANTGTAAATTVVMTDAVDSRLTYVNGSIAGTGADASNPALLRWVIGTISAGTGGTTAGFRATVNTGAAGAIPNAASMTAVQWTLASPPANVVVSTGGIVLGSGPPA
ncbi:MAG: DUF11 domain-containing protein [Planctomycetota bacterium]